MSDRLTLGVDASFVSRDRRGMGRCIRSILAAWEAKIPHRLVLLCHARRHLDGLAAYTQAGFEVAWRQKAPRLDVCWFPWNRVDWDPHCPRVVHIHDVAPFTEYHPETRHLAQDRERLIQAAQHADRVVTDSNFSRTEIHRHLDVAWDRMEVIPLAKDQIFQPAPPTPPQASVEVLEKLGDAPFLLYVGNLEPRKNLHGLLEAYTLLSHRPRLVLVCPRPTSSWTERLRGKVAPLTELCQSMEDQLVWLEDVDDQTLAELYRRCRLFVMPSFYEGFGLPLLEAMACGTPTAAARAASLPEVGGEAPYWFHPGDPVDIARVIMEALAVPRESSRPLQQAASFSWDTTAARILEVLEQSVKA